MFKNAGKKLSIFLKVKTIIEMILVLLVGLVGLAISAEQAGPIGMLLTLSGILVVEIYIWLFSLFLIGFCEMMADVYKIRNVVVNGQFNGPSNGTSNGYSFNGNQRNEKLEELRQKGLITEQEYLSRVNAQ